MLTKSNIKNKMKNTNNRFLGMNSGAKISSQRYIYCTCTWYIMQIQTILSSNFFQYTRALIAL